MNVIRFCLAVFLVAGCSASHSYQELPNPVTIEWLSTGYGKIHEFRLKDGTVCVAVITGSSGSYGGLHNSVTYANWTEARGTAGADERAGEANDMAESQDSCRTA